MATKRFWQGFAAGALAGAAGAAGTLLFSNIRGRAGKSRILRLEKSIQIGRPVEEVFDAWQRLEQLPKMSRRVREVRRVGSRSHWRVNAAGREVEWEAQIEQIIPKQSIGWKSVRGPRHTGRISFSPIGADTLVHVSMNYVPPARLLRPLLAPMSGDLEGAIEAVLRDFKRALETGEQIPQSGPRAYPAGTTTEPARATGTFGVAPSAPAQTSETSQHSRFAAPQNPVEFTAPPETKR